MSFHLDGNPFADEPDEEFPPARAVKRPRGETEDEEPCGDETAPERKAPRVDSEAAQGPEEEPCNIAEEEPCNIAEEEPCNIAEEEPCNIAEEEPCNIAEEEPCNIAEEEPCNILEEEPGNIAEEETCNIAEEEPCNIAEEEPCNIAEEETCNIAEEETCNIAEEEPCNIAEEEPGNIAEEEPCNIAEEEPGNIAEGVEAEDVCGSLRGRAARLEAAQRRAVQHHRFHLDIAAQENEALRACVQDLRRSLIALQQQRRTGAASSGGGNEAAKSADPVALARLLLAHESVVAEQRWEAHMTEMRRFAAAAQDPMDTEEELHTEDERNAEEETGAVDKSGDDAMDGALAPLLPALDPNTAALARALVREVRNAGAQRDAMLAWSARAIAQARRLEARVRRAAVTSPAAEQPLLTALQQCASHTAARDAARRFAESEPQRIAARRRVERAELALAALFAACAGAALPPQNVPPISAAANEELERICALLSREVVYLRRADFVPPPPAPAPSSAISAASASVPSALRRGRDALLRHCCAGLFARLAELTRRIVLSLLTGTASAPPTAAQDALLHERRARVDSQRAVMRAFLTENARLQRQLSESDAQAPLVAAYNAALSHIRAATQAHADAGATAGSALRAATAALALRLRLSNATDRARLAEVGVAVERPAAVAVAAALARLDGGAEDCAGHCASALRPIAAPVAEARPPAAPRAALAAERESVLAALSAREGDLEWCRQQCPRACAAALRGAAAEVAGLRAEIAALPARGAEAAAGRRREAAQLRARAKRCRVQCAAAEEQWRRAVRVEAAAREGETENEEAKEAENEGGEERSASAMSPEREEYMGEENQDELAGDS